METKLKEPRDWIPLDVFRSVLKSFNEISKFSHNTQLSIEETLKIFINKIQSAYRQNTMVNITIQYKGQLFSTKNKGNFQTTHELPLKIQEQEVGKLSFAYDPNASPSEQEKIINDLFIEVVAEQINLYLEHYSSSEHLFENAKFLKTLLDTIPSPIFYKDANEIFLGCNQIYAKLILNIEQENVIGKTVFDFPDYITPKLAERYHAKDAALLKSGGFQAYDSKILCADGEQREFLIFRQAIKNKNQEITGLIGIMTDITSVNKLARKYQLLATSVESLNEAILILNASGEIEYANPAYRKLTGIKDTDASFSGIESFLGTDQASDAFESMLKTVFSGEVWQANISEFSTKNSKYDVDATASPITEADGTITNIVVILRDNSEIKKIEQRLNQAQKLESIGHLAAGIAHEINTPTQYVYNNLSFLRESVEDIRDLLSTLNDTFQQENLPQNQMKTLQSQFCETAEMIDLPFLLEEIPLALNGMEKGLKRVSQIVSAMKEFSHPGKAEKIMTDINHNINNTITVSRNEWKYTTNLTTHFDENLPHIPCLPGEFNQVILNLIVNASDAIKEKFTDAQEISGSIQITTEKISSSYVRIRIKDNANGIPAGIQEKVFDPFFTTKQIGKGTGQGLSIAYNVIVNKLQGKIWLETTIGKGTEFFIELPINEKVGP